MAASEATVVDLQDRRLLQRHLAGDADAFATLLRRFGPAVWSLLARHGLHGPDREDAYQEVFARVHRSADTYRSEHPLRPWLATVAMRVAKDRHRRRRVEALVAGEAAPSVAATAPDELAAIETADFLTQRIAELAPERREVLELCALQGLAHKDAARRLDLPVNTVKTRLRRARLDLAEALRRRRHTVEREST